jgi:adenine-specific DNA methylase
VPPLQNPVIAKPHTPVYQMHRYFARRPWNVFEHIIKHYTNAGDLILDPFCGGGVTVYEGLKLRRRVIGIDLNPLATWITRMQIEPVDLEEVEKAFNQVVKQFKPLEEELYSTECNDCGKKVIAEWFEWSNVLICPGCGKEVVLAEAKKLRGGKYECTNDKCLDVLEAIINRNIKYLT